MKGTNLIGWGALAVGLLLVQSTTNPDRDAFGQSAGLGGFDATGPTPGRQAEAGPLPTTPQEVVVQQQQLGELMAFASGSQEAGQQITVIDSRTRVMSVYHVEEKTGSISLKSVRSIEADLRMDEFNTASPAPREIRAMLKQN